MKKAKMLGTMLAIVVGSGMCAFGKGPDAPEKVKAAFAQKFPTVKKVKWGKESETEWEGSFKLDGVAYSANFLQDGTWQETEHEVESKAIPENVKMTLESQFVGFKIKEAELSETPTATVYEFELKKDGKEMEVAIDRDGKVVG